MAADLELVRRLGAAAQGLVVLSTARADGRVHSSVVNAGVVAEAPGGGPRVGVVARGDARKLDHLRHSGRANVVFRSGWEWVAVEGPVTLVGPDHPLDGVGSDALATLLRDIFVAAGGTHDDWNAYDETMRRERRTAVLVLPDHIVSN